MPDINGLPFWSTNKQERLTQILMIILSKTGGTAKLRLSDYWKLMGKDVAIVHQLDRKSNDLIIRLVTKAETDKMRADAVKAIGKDRLRGGEN